MIPNGFARRVLAVTAVASIGVVIVPSAALAGPSSTHRVGGCTVVESPTQEHHTDCPGANLTRASLSNAKLSFANFSGADLTYADLSGADLSNANLTGAKLTYANMIAANFSRAELSGAFLFGAMVNRANLFDVHWYNTLCPSGAFTKPKGALERCPRLDRPTAHR
jgi:Pentapeptide repeats (8 copies)